MDNSTLLAVGVSVAAAAAAVGCMFASKGLSASGSSSGSKKTKRVRVASVHELGVGKMKEVELPAGTTAVNKAKVLLVRTSKTRWRATGATCTHGKYMGQLSAGVLSGDRVVCPLHGACFNVDTGDIEDGPAFDKLPTFPVTVVGEDVFVDVPVGATAAELSREAPHMCPAAASDRRHFLIIGAGPCGLAAAETLRREGFTGRITLLNKEGGLPYDRPKVSKSMSVPVESLLLRPREWFTQNGIAVRDGAVAQSVDTAGKAVVLASGERIAYDKLLCASGGPARTFRKDAGESFVIEGAELEGVFPLRTAAHGAAIEARADAVIAAGGRIVVLGSSFIGMEAAAYLKAGKAAPHVTVIGMEAVPFERVLGKAVGTMVQALHEDRGVAFEMNAVVARFTANPSKPGEVGGVELKSGKVLPADLVIVGAGIIPATDYLKGAEGVTLHNAAPGGVKVDERMCAGPPDVFAAGDIAYFPLALGGHTGYSRIEHWDVAIDQGRVAALNMLGKGVSYAKVPFFWTQQYGRSLRYAGHSLKTDDVIVHHYAPAGAAAGAAAVGGAAAAAAGAGRAADAPWVAYYVADGAVAAVATFAKDPFAAAAMELFRLGALPPVHLLRDAAQTGTGLNLVQYLEQASASAAAAATGGRRNSEA